MNVQSVQTVPAVQIVRRSEAVEQLERLELYIQRKGAKKEVGRNGISDHSL
jgi:hypothetical protein